MENDSRRRYEEGEVMHINIETKREYKGKNIKTLDKVYKKEDYEHKIWGTFCQWKSRGHSVDRGQKGVKLCFYNPNIQMTSKDEQGNDVVHKGYSHFRVYNLEQTTPERELEKLQKGKM
jgi:antirestriction protein ArdC